MPPKPKDQPVLAEATIGPTRETKRHGEYVKPETRGATVIYTNRAENRLARLQRDGFINGKQAAGGYAFERTWIIRNGSGTKDSLDMSPRGGVVHETESAAERLAKAKARLHTILQRVGPGRYSMLVSVCVFGETIGRLRGNERVYELLREALDQCAIAYGLDGA